MSEQWSEWIEWSGGPCPIAWALAGEYEVESKRGGDGCSVEWQGIAGKEYRAAAWRNCWEHKSMCWPILRFRYRIDRAPAGFVHPSPLSAERAQRLSDEKAEQERIAQSVTDDNARMLASKPAERSADHRADSPREAAYRAKQEAKAAEAKKPPPKPEVPPGLGIVAPITRLGGWL